MKKPLRPGKLLCFLMIIFTCLWGTAFSQGKRVTGVVKDKSSGEAIPGVSIIISGTNTGTMTDADGVFALDVTSDSDILVVSFVGYTKQEIPVAGKTTIDIALDPDITTLEEVMIVGYGVQKKSVVTGAIAKVTTDDLKASKDLRIEQALQGRTAGVIIMNNSGQPGDNVTIRIRGTGTNGDPDPLFIVDGLPMEKEGLDYLNPSDVESIEVLKDAASAAIYGTRGANGVVLITTKQGRKGQRLSVTYDGYYGVQNPWRKLKMLNSTQYVDIINEAAFNDGAGPYFTDAEIATFTANTDWQAEMLNENAPKSSHTVSFNGGGENSTFSSSLNYYTQDGIVAKGKSEFDRITYRLNTSFDFGKVTIGSNLNLVNIKTKGIGGNDMYGLGIAQALNIPSIVPVKHPDGDWAVPNDFGIGLQEITNPVALMSYLHAKTATYKALGNIYGEIEIIKGLKVRTNFSGELAFVNGTSYTPAYDLDPTHRRPANSVWKNVHRYQRWNLDNTITYERSFGKHNMTALAGMTRFKEWDEGLSASKDSLIFNDLEHAYLNNSLQVKGTTGNSISEHTLQSFFGRLNYNFDEKYMFEGVLRVDGSSRFGSENRYGYFPAVSAGWVISRESFFPESPVFEFAKLRASWGQNGNENIGNFRYTSIMQRGLNYFFGTGQVLYNGMQPDFYSNPSIKWETSQQTDIGLDLGFFSNRLTFTVDYYDKRTKDWLITAPLPRLLGNSEPVINAGEVQNKGFEFEVGYKNEMSNGLLYNLKLTASTNRSELLSLNTPTGSFNGGTGSHGQGGILRAQVGKPLGYFWGYVTEGIFQNEEDLAAYPHQPNAKPGDLKFRDGNGDGKLDDLDRENIGNPYPKLILGLNTSFDFKNFDLSMFWYTGLGHQIWMANRRNDLIYANYTTDILDRWYAEGTSNEMPRVTLSDPNETWKKPSDFYIHDADFLRLKNITLGYSIPASIVNKLTLKRVRVYVTSENLLTFTKYKGMEVEVGGGGPLDVGIDHGVYPQSRTFLTGLQIGF
jgi:TonB-dependent starch-binding outer membrane protein SusC